MKEIVTVTLLTMVLLFGGPWLLIAETEELPEDEPESQISQDEAVTLRVWDGEKTVEMTMAEYLPGVVRGEMPASFEAQALAAQAVAERTYIYYQMQNGRKDKHPDADICMDHTCCNAWVSEEEAGEKWGENTAAYEEKIRQAVQSTDGQVMLYEGKPVLAAFHSSSAGVTASSEDAWVSRLPYLVSVESPESAENVPNYYSVKSLQAEEFRTLFLKEYPEADLSGKVSEWIGEAVRNDSDRVEEIAIGGVKVSGTEVRRIFSLRSACFTVETEGEKLTFHVTGYGHGVGMSQYGANELAREGKSWQEILSWYYTGVTITRYTK